MAEALDDGEFWLPSEFLTDDDIIMERTKTGFRKSNETGFETGFFFPSEFPYESSPPLSSPVESLVGSESDEEDFLAGFTRQMARSLLQDTEYNASAVLNPKTRVMSGSPQSPLCGMGTWSNAGSGGGSSRGSPNGPSQVPSPPETPLTGKDDAWDLLYAAAGQVVRMKLNEEGVAPNALYGRGLLGVPHKAATTPAHVPVTSLPFKNPNVGCYPNQVLTRQQIQANHFLQLKQQQQQQQQQQCSPVWERQVKQSSQQALNGGRPVPVGIGNGRYNRPLGLPPSAWPPLQSQHPQSGSGMRAVFLGGSGGRRECSGTGVFLPRRNGIASDSRRKPACSTVLLPDRVVQALNRSFDDMGGVAPHPQARYVGGMGVVPAAPHGNLHGNQLLSHQQQKRSFRPQPTINTAEVQLPQEWTY